MKFIAVILTLVGASLSFAGEKAQITVQRRGLFGRRQQIKVETQSVVSGHIGQVQANYVAPQRIERVIVQEYAAPQRARVIVQEYAAPQRIQRVILQEAATEKVILQQNVEGDCGGVAQFSAPTRFKLKSGY